MSAPFGENTYVAHLTGSRDAVVVDPGMEPEQIIAYLEREAIDAGRAC